MDGRPVHLNAPRPVHPFGSRRVLWPLLVAWRRNPDKEPVAPDLRLSAAAGRHPMRTAPVPTPSPGGGNRREGHRGPVASEFGRHQRPVHVRRRCGASADGPLPTPVISHPRPVLAPDSVARTVESGASCGGATRSTGRDRLMDLRLDAERMAPRDPAQIERDLGRSVVGDRAGSLGSDASTGGRD